MRNGHHQGGRLARSAGSAEGRPEGYRGVGASDFTHTNQRGAESVSYRDDAALDAMQRKAEMIIRNIFGISSKYLEDLGDISFYPSVYPASPEYYLESWAGGKSSMSNLITTMRDELTIFGDQTKLVDSIRRPDRIGVNTKVFIVHGHDETMKVSAARTVEKLGLVPIILHEKPNQGRTVIEKFADYADVEFAVVLLSPDDLAVPSTESPEKLRPRARQNVIFEMGYFIGKLGRERVVALYRAVSEFELPSDYSGVLYVAYDNTGRWQFDLVRELSACGYNVDANRLLAK